MSRAIVPHRIAPEGAHLVSLSLVPLAAGGRVTGLPALLIILLILVVIIAGVVSIVRFLARRASGRR